MQRKNHRQSHFHALYLFSRKVLSKTVNVFSCGLLKNNQWIVNVNTLKSTYITYWSWSRYVVEGYYLIMIKLLQLVKNVLLDQLEGFWNTSDCQVGSLFSRENAIRLRFLKYIWNSSFVWVYSCKHVPKYKKVVGNHSLF